MSNLSSEQQQQQQFYQQQHEQHHHVMDHSYAGTPYPAASIGRVTPQPRIVPSLLSSGTAGAFVIAPPTPTGSVPPSQAPTVIGEPVFIESAPEQSPSPPSQLFFQPSSPSQQSISPQPQQQPGLFASTAAADLFPNSYEQMPSHPQLHMAHSPRLNSRLRNTTDTMVMYGAAPQNSGLRTPSFAFYPQQQQQARLASPALAMQPVAMQAGMGKPEADVEQPQHQQQRQARKGRVGRVHASISRILLPYWMLTMTLLLAAVVVVLLRTLLSLSTLKASLDLAASRHTVQVAEQQQQQQPSSQPKDVVYSTNSVDGKISGAPLHAASLPSGIKKNVEGGGGRGRRRPEQQVWLQAEPF